MLSILECVEQLYKPRCASGGKNVPLNQHVSHLVHLDQRPLPQLLQSTDLSRLAFPRKEHLAVSSLTNLGDNVELGYLELRAPLSEECSLAPEVGGSIFGVVRISWVCSHLKVSETLLAVGNVSEVVKVVVEKV